MYRVHLEISLCTVYKNILKFHCSSRRRVRHKNFIILKFHRDTWDDHGCHWNVSADIYRNVPRFWRKVFIFTNVKYIVTDIINIRNIFTIRHCIIFFSRQSKISTGEASVLMKIRNPTNIWRYFLKFPLGCSRVTLRHDFVLEARSCWSTVQVNTSRFRIDSEV